MVRSEDSRMHGWMQIGSLVLTKNGNVKLHIGCAKYDVTPGVSAHHRSELHLLNLKTKDIVLAATDLPSAVASLDLSSLLSAD